MEKLQKFKDHLDKTVVEHMNEIEEGNVDERFDIDIKLNGQNVIIPLSADSYESLTRLIDIEIENMYITSSVDNNERVDIEGEMRWLGELQEHLVSNGDLYDWFVTFKAYSDIIVVNPFKDELSGMAVNPFEYYGEELANSQWFSRFHTVMVSFKGIMLDFLAYVTGDEEIYSDESFEFVLTKFLREVANDVIVNDFEVKDEEVEQRLKDLDLYYPAIGVLLELYTSRNPHKHFDNVLEHSLKDYLEEVYTIG